VSVSVRSDGGVSVSQSPHTDQDRHGRDWFSRACTAWHGRTIAYGMKRKSLGRLALIAMSVAQCCSAKSCADRDARVAVTAGEVDQRRSGVRRPNHLSLTSS
jgi:hypothetical protein